MNETHSVTLCLGKLVFLFIACYNENAGHESECQERGGIVKKIMNDITGITEKLKELIDSNGPSYLKANPYEVYKALVSSGIANEKAAGAVFCVIVNKLNEDAEIITSEELFSAAVQKSCGFNKKLSDFTASIFTGLYSTENNAEWKSREKDGLNQFLKEKMTFGWKGFAVWEDGSGSVDCHYSASIVLMPTAGITVNKKFEKMLSDNPFINKEAITDFFQKELWAQLDMDFEEYCTCDYYYEPVAEDFEIEEYISEWCSKNGFELVSCEGEGSTDDYESDYRGGYY